jgi:hypothetical protein
MTNRSSPGYLDGVRLRRGPDELIQTFRTLVQRDRAGAIARLNEERLQFPAFSSCCRSFGSWSCTIP